MLKKNKLSIHILHYKRTDNLFKLLSSLSPIAKLNNIKIKVFDDSGNANLYEKFRLLKISFKNVVFVFNKKNMGYDHNYIKSLKEFQSQYVWVIGDSYVINLVSFKKVISKLENNNHDLYILNTGNRLKKNIKINRDLETVIKDFTWHITLIGSLIYSKKILKNTNFTQLKKFKNFPQVGIFLDFVSKSKIFFYINCNPFFPLKKVSYWKKYAFETFLKDLPNALNYSFIKNNISLKNKIIITHLVESKLLSLKSLFFISLNENIIKNYFKYEIYLNKFFFNFLIIYLIPKSLKKIIVNIFNLKSFINESWKKN
jgi:hypothetical protein